MTEPRIAPVEPPYTAELSASFDRIMPPGVPPLTIFRTYARHPALLERTMALGATLMHKSSVTPRDRELVLLRTCARCGSSYEWGVHAATLSRAFGLTDEEIAGTASEGYAWNEYDRRLIALADQLHDRSDLSDELWRELAEVYDDAQLIELISTAGMYHAISFMTNALRMQPEAFSVEMPT